MISKRLIPLLATLAMTGPSIAQQIEQTTSDPCSPAVANVTGNVRIFFNCNVSDNDSRAEVLRSLRSLYGRLSGLIYLQTSTLQQTLVTYLALPRREAWERVQDTAKAVSEEIRSSFVDLGRYIALQTLEKLKDPIGPELRRLLQEREGVLNVIQRTSLPNQKQALRLLIDYLALVRRLEGQLEAIARVLLRPQDACNSYTIDYSEGFECHITLRRTDLAKIFLVTICTYERGLLHLVCGRQDRDREM